MTVGHRASTLVGLVVGCTMLHVLPLVTLTGAPSPVTADPKDELLAPVKILADGTPIDAYMGHAAPFFIDFDGDGVMDLLVGQFGEGKLAIYRNTGTNRAPRFDRKEWFLAGSEPGRVPFS